MNKYYIGTELKFALTITSSGFDMARDPWTATITNGKNSVLCRRGRNVVLDNSDLWYITVNTTDLGTGQYYLIVEIDVPDDDFLDGYRHEVLKQSRPLCNVLKL